MKKRVSVIGIVVLLLAIAMSGTVFAKTTGTCQSKNTGYKLEAKKIKKSTRNKRIRKALGIPKKAKVKIKVSKKFYWSGAGMYLRSVSVRGKGKYKKYHASGDFTLDYKDVVSMMSWSKY